jgi:hypothetical protein
VVIRATADGQWEMWDKTDQAVIVSRKWLARRWPGPGMRVTLPTGSKAFRSMAHNWLPISSLVCLICCVASLCRAREKRE